jgi:hypothetical protein
MALIRDLLQFLRGPSNELDELVAKDWPIPQTTQYEVSQSGYKHREIVYLHGFFLGDSWER